MCLCTSLHVTTHSPSAQLESDYPLLLLHLHVGVRELPQRTADAAAGEGDVLSASTLRELRLAEAKRLGDALDYLLD